MSFNWLYFRPRNREIAYNVPPSPSNILNTFAKLETYNGKKKIFLSNLSQTIHHTSNFEVLSAF